MCGRGARGGPAERGRFCEKTTGEGESCGATRRESIGGAKLLVVVAVAMLDLDGQSERRGAGAGDSRVGTSTWGGSLIMPLSMPLGLGLLVPLGAMGSMPDAGPATADMNPECFNGVDMMRDGVRDGAGW